MLISIKARLTMLYAFFWVIPRRLNFSHLPAYEDGTDRVFRNVCI